MYCLLVYIEQLEGQYCLLPFLLLPAPAEGSGSATPGAFFGCHLQTAICTGIKMAVASRAVMIAEMIVARVLDMELAR